MGDQTHDADGIDEPAGEEILIGADGSVGILKEVLFNKLGDGDFDGGVFCHGCFRAVGRLAFV